MEAAGNETNELLNIEKVLRSETTNPADLTSPQFDGFCAFRVRVLLTTQV